MSVRERMYPQVEELPVFVRLCFDAHYVGNLALEQRNVWIRGRARKIACHFYATEPAESWRETWLREGACARVPRDRVDLWYVSFTRLASQIERESTGIGMGVTHTDGQFLGAPKLLIQGENRRTRQQQRKLTRQVKGSKHKKRTKLAITKLSARESDRHKDWIAKMAIELVRDYDLIAREDLKVKSITRRGKNPGTNVKTTAGLNRAILDQRWGRLTNKATNTTSPAELIFVDLAYTSLRCSECGYTDKKSHESQAILCCQACGHTITADVNAAKKMIAAGLGVYGRQGTSHVEPNTAQHRAPMQRQLAEAA